MSVRGVCGDEVGSEEGEGAPCDLVVLVRASEGGERRGTHGGDGLHAEDEGVGEHVSRV